MKVGDLEVTALLDGSAVFDPHWLTGKKVAMDRVEKDLHDDPHLLDVGDAGFLGQHRQATDPRRRSAGTWYGGGALGHLVDSLRSAGYAPEEVDRVLVTHLHSDHVGGLTTQDESASFPNADVFVSKAESDFWLSPEIAAKAPKMRSVLPECASHRGAGTSRPASGTRSAAPRRVLTRSISFR